MATVRWHMAYQLGITGFKIYANHTNLTKSLIHTHHSKNYTAHVKWVASARYTLHVLFKNGHTQVRSLE